MTRNTTYTTHADVQEAVDKATKRIDLLLTGVVIVMFVGFLTLLFTALSPIIDAWRFKASSYEELRNQIQQQNQEIKDQGSKIDVITKGLQKYQILPP